MDATWYFLLVHAIIAGFVAANVALSEGLSSSVPFFLLPLGLAIVSLWLVRGCRKMTPNAYLASMVFGLVAAGLSLGVAYAAIVTLLLILQIQIIFFAYRAYEEITRPATTN